MPHRNAYALVCGFCDIIEHFDADDQPERCSHCGYSYDAELRAAEQKEAEEDAELCKQIDQEIRAEADDLYVSAMIASRGERLANDQEDYRRRHVVRGSWGDRG